MARGLVQRAEVGRGNVLLPNSQAAGVKSDDVALLLAQHLQAPFDATLLMVNSDVVGWARAALLLIASAGAKVVSRLKLKKACSSNSLMSPGMSRRPR